MGCRHRSVCRPSVVCPVATCQQQHEVKQQNVPHTQVLYTNSSDQRDQQAMTVALRLQHLWHAATAPFSEKQSCNNLVLCM